MHFLMYTQAHICPHVLECVSSISTCVYVPQCVWVCSCVCPSQEGGWGRFPDTATLSPSLQPGPKPHYTSSQMIRAQGCSGGTSPTSQLNDPHTVVSGLTQSWQFCDHRTPLLCHIASLSRVPWETLTPDPGPTHPPASEKAPTPEEARVCEALRDAFVDMGMGMPRTPEPQILRQRTKPCLPLHV